MTAPKILEHEDKESWLEARRGGIGSSDAPIILGLSSWSSPYDLWAQKTGKVDSNGDENLRMRVGHHLEPLIHEETERQEGVQLMDPGDFTIFQHPEKEILQATLDRLIVAPEKGKAQGFAEFKTVSYQGDDWRDDPSPYAVVQAQHQHLVSTLDEALIVALIFGKDGLKVFPSEPHEELQAILLEALEEFWDHVQRDEPPPVDGSPHTSRALDALYPEDSGGEIELPEEFVEVKEKLDLAGEKIKHWKKEKKELKNRVKEALGDNTFGYVPGYGWQFKWATFKKGGYTVEPTQYRQLRTVKRD